MLQSRVFGARKVWRNTCFITERTNTHLGLFHRFVLRGVPISFIHMQDVRTEARVPYVTCQLFPAVAGSTGTRAHLSGSKTYLNQKARHALKTLFPLMTHLRPENVLLFYDLLVVVVFFLKRKG